MATTDALNVKVTADNSDFQRKMGQSGKSLDEFAINAQNASASALGSFKGLAAGIAALGIGAALKSSLTFAGDLEQNMGGSEAVFKDYAATIQATAKQAYSALGLSESKYLATANKMGALFQGSGFSIGKSAEMTTQAMQRASDVASIMGVEVSAAMEAVAGAAKGNFTMMDNLGVAMNDTTLQTYAQEKGLGKLETTQQKVNAAMQMFIDKTDYAAGNYARENDTYAGALTTLKAEFENTMAELGSAFLPLATTVIPIISEGIKIVAPYIKGLAEGISGIGQAIINLNGPALMFAKIAVISAATIGAVTLATKALSTAKLIYGAVLTILTPKVWSFGTALKFAAGWIGIIAGALAIFSALGSSSPTETVTESADETADSADKAADSTDNLKDSIDGLGKASKSLAGFDEITKLSGSGSGNSLASGIATAEDIENILAASEGVGTLQDEINGLDMKLDLDFGNMLSDVGKAWDGLVASVKSGEFGKKLLRGLATTITGETDTQIIDTAYQNMFNDIFSGNWSKFADNIAQGAAKTDFIKGMLSMVSGIKDDEVLSNAAYNMYHDIFSGNWDSFWEKWLIGAPEFFGGIFETIQPLYDTFLKKFLDPWGSLLSDLGYGSELKLNTDFSNVPMKMSKLTALEYDTTATINANNHGGAGRSRAVKNSTVDTSGIAEPFSSAGVYDAVSAALNGQSGNGTTRIETTVELDGEAVGKSVTEYQNGQTNVTNGRQ